MRIRSALAATVLAAALTAAGAATATALDQRVATDETVPCSPYAGSIDAETADIEWAGAVCHNGVFDF
ncbi:hypothetical protein ACIP2X_25095 [Streptomyces sp. NPDC089424]|uniref:hypothetical protein n=1 Tax=Streptomyces sp. NPDC089424 TaxID=3365917 RepID=UPI00380942B0